MSSRAEEHQSKDHFLDAAGLLFRKLPASTSLIFLAKRHH